MPAFGNLSTPAASTSVAYVLLDTFKAAGDADDTASLNRAVAAGVAIALGPKIYTVNSVAIANTVPFLQIKGVPGVSTFKRTTNSGSTAFFGCKAAVVNIEGVIFDMNSGSVTTNNGWGVLFNQAGQDITIKQCVFKNNNGSLAAGIAISSTGPAAGGKFKIQDTEIFGCPFTGIYVGSACNGLIKDCYVHDCSSFGMFIGTAGAVSTTNYVTNVVAQSNRVYTCGTGIQLGGFGSPYVYGTPSAISCSAKDNIIQDCTGYQLTLQGDSLTATGNLLTQSSPSVTVLGGIDCNSRYTLMANNRLIFSGISYGIDTGSSIESSIKDNYIQMDHGTAINLNGNQQSTCIDNTIDLTGTGFGIPISPVDSAAGGLGINSVSSATVVRNNTFNMIGSSTRGVFIFDNAGGYPGSLGPNHIVDNYFNISGSGANPTQAVGFDGAHGSAVINGNLYNGSNVAFLDPSTSPGDVVFDWVFLGGEIRNISSTNTVRSLLPRDLSNFGFLGGIVWVMPNNGGTNYGLHTTTLSASSTGGGSGWAGVATINADGVIIGVTTTAKGSGYSGTVTITATDSSGAGSGATFTSSLLPVIPQFSTITYVSASPHLFAGTGGYLGNSTRPYYMDSTSKLQLEINFSGTQWDTKGFSGSTIVFGSLPAADSTLTGAVVKVTGSVSGKWEARCDGTNWIAPDGITIT